MPTKVNINQLVKATGVSRRTLYYWVSRGFLPPPEKRGHASLWDMERVKETLAQTKRRLVA
jgi:predicted DNA-binding transcriptional regulator AlpA